MHLEMAQVVMCLFHLFLVYALQTQGSYAVTNVPVKTGNDLTLNLTAEIPKDFSLWLWQFAGHAVVEFSNGSLPKIDKNYTGRIEVLEKTHSLKLKKLQKSDSGIYTAKVVLPKEEILAEYKVEVQATSSAATGVSTAAATVLQGLITCVLLRLCSSAVTDVFVKTGDDLVLNLTEAESPQNSRLWLWQFTGEAMVRFSSDSPPDVQKNFIQRIEVLDKKYSVKLKNLQKSHSGTYTAKVILPTEKILIEYNITVKDPVSPVNLTIIPMTGTTSSCILTLICSADNLSINVTLRCKNQSCNLEEREKTEVTKSGSTLRIYEKNASIVCTHKNQVSQNEEQMTQNHCPQPTVFVSEPRKQFWYIAFAIALLIAVIVIVTACKSYKKGGDKETTDNTIYAIPVMNNQTETLNETAKDEARSPSSTYSTVGPHLSKLCKKTAKDEARSPSSTYSTVGPHLSKECKKTAKDEARSPTTTYSASRPSTRGNDQPESVYSQIQMIF